MVPRICHRTASGEALALGKEALGLTAVTCLLESQRQANGLVQGQLDICLIANRGPLPSERTYTEVERGFIIRGRFV